MTGYRNIRLYGLAIVLLFLGIVLASRSSGKNEQPRSDQEQGQIKPIERVEDLRIRNRTSLFNIAKIRTVSDKVFEITYRNDYSKAITGFEVAIGGMTVQTELILGGDEQEFISPGNILQKAYAAQEGLDRNGIQILAVVFDDGSSDGDIRFIKEITDYREGIKTERQRVLALLEPVINSKPENISAALAALETDISSSIAPTRQDNKLDNVGAGMRSERRRMLDEIRMVREKHQYAQLDEEKARQLHEDLLIVKAMSESIIKLASPSSGQQRRSR